MTHDEIRAQLDSLSKGDQIRIKSIQVNMRWHIKKGVSISDALHKVRQVARYAIGRLGDMALAKIEANYPADGWEGQE